MMKTWSPTCAWSELPMRATVAWAGTLSSCSSDTSAWGSEAITRAPTTWPSRNSAVIWSAVCTTWAAVMTLPSSEISTPEPTSFTRPDCPLAPTSFHRARMITTEPLTRRNTGPRFWASAVESTGRRSRSSRTVSERFIEALRIGSGRAAGASRGRRRWPRGRGRSPRS